MESSRTVKNFVQLEVNNSLGIKLEGKGNGIKRAFNFLLVSLLNTLPERIMRRVIIGGSQEVSEVYKFRTRTLALEIIYNYKWKSLFRNSFIDALVYNIMNNVENCRAVRNRLRIAEYYLKEVARNNSKDVLTITSIAAGSARAIAEVAKHFSKGYKNLEITFLDKDPYAITYSKKLFERFGLTKRYRLRWIQDDVFNIRARIKDNSQDIVEIIGLADYFDFTKSVQVFTDSYKILRHGGYFVTANIRENRESSFVTNLFHWKMEYKEPKELYQILLGSGFSADNITLISEPLGIHTIAIAQKA